jgi:hypothetical protein
LTRAFSVGIGTIDLLREAIDLIRPSFLRLRRAHTPLTLTALSLNRTVHAMLGRQVAFEEMFAKLAGS